ncbi:hypothetical protein V8C40DRAFT_255575 [Trichoderma camerunense]
MRSIHVHAYVPQRVLRTGRSHFSQISPTCTLPIDSFPHVPWARQDILSLAKSSIAKPPHSPSPALESHSIHFAFPTFFSSISFVVYLYEYATSAPLDRWPLSMYIDLSLRPPEGLPCNRPCPRAHSRDFCIQSLLRKSPFN